MSIENLFGLNRSGDQGVTSVCSAHPWVIEATLRRCLADGRTVLIEATCNQVNQEGGYTGMTPGEFVSFTRGIASQVGLAPDRIVLGGDHLGPNPWRGLCPEAAMQKAEAMVAAYAAAGFGKIHLDASMGCAGEPESVGDERAAARAARLAAVAEAAASRAGHSPPVYVIGTEVPSPGGAREPIEGVLPTTADAARRTHSVHAEAFVALGLGDAFRRVVALVVQPGVEFGDNHVVHYDPLAAAGLSAALVEMPGLSFEAHSTDYQSPGSLGHLVRDGFRILKVGPWLTFALREALYGLDAIVHDLAPHASGPGLKSAMERLMLDEPEAWRGYYGGEDDQQELKRHFSYSDRIRYYWPHHRAQAAVADLLTRLEGVIIPAPLIGQHLGRIAAHAEALEHPATAKDLVLASVDAVLAIYADAVQAQSAAPSKPLSSTSYSAGAAASFASVLGSRARARQTT